MSEVFSRVNKFSILVLSVLVTCTPQLLLASEPIQLSLPGARVVLKSPNLNLDDVDETMSYWNEDLDQRQPTVEIYINPGTESLSPLGDINNEDDRLDPFGDDSDVAEVADPEGMHETRPVPVVAVYYVTETNELGGIDDDRLNPFGDDSDVAEVADPEGVTTTNPNPVVAVYMSVGARETDLEEDDRLNPLGDDTDVAEVADPEGRMGTANPQVIVYVANHGLRRDWMSDLPRSDASRVVVVVQAPPGQDVLNLDEN